MQKDRRLRFSLECFYRLAKRFRNSVKLTFLEFDVQLSAAIGALLAVDEGKVFLVQALDKGIDVTRGVLL
jgi:hypothetical protein